MIHFQSIDSDAQGPTYFMAAYFESRNIVAVSIWVYRIVRSLTRYMVTLVRFHKTGNGRNSLLTKQVHNQEMSF